MKKENYGFTLVELVVTMVILSVISVMTSNFIVSGFSFYVDATNVQKVSSQAVFVTQKIDKLFRNAIPYTYSQEDYDLNNELTFQTFKTVIDVRYLYDSNGEDDDTFYGLKNVTSNTSFYGLKSPFRNVEIKNNQTRISYRTDNEERKYSVVSNCSSTESDIYYCFKFKDNPSFISQGRVYVIDSCMNLKFDEANSSLILEKWSNCDSTATKYQEVLATNIARFKVKNVPLSYNRGGELEFEYEFKYPDESLGTKKIYQRIGVTNAP